MNDIVNASFARFRFLAVLLGAFAVLALALAVFGMYAVVSYLVAQRTREIGVRMALGATQHDIVRLISREILLVMGGGVAAGTAAAFAATGLISGFLFEIRATDPVTFVTAPLLIASAAIVAALVPARRAAQVDPAMTLRAE